MKLSINNLYVPACARLLLVSPLAAFHYLY
jgi:hypothetical protein